MYILLILVYNYIIMSYVHLLVTMLKVKTLVYHNYQYIILAHMNLLIIQWFII